MPTAAPSPTDDLAQEITKLQNDLAAAERARIRPEDVAADVLRQRLSDAQHELFLQQERESRVLAEEQHACDLAALVQLEQRALTAKRNLDAMRSTYSRLATEIQKAEFEHGILLGQYAKLKREIGL